MPAQLVVMMLIRCHGSDLGGPRQIFSIQIAGIPIHESSVVVGRGGERMCRADLNKPLRISPKIATFPAFLGHWLGILPLLTGLSMLSGQDTPPRRPVSSPPPISTSWSDLTPDTPNQTAWLEKKKFLKQRFLDLIRDQHRPQKPTLDLQIHEEVEVEGIYRRQLVSYNVEAGERAHAYIAIPLDRKEAGPAVVALHGTYPRGKEQAAGLEPDKTRAHLDHLARRGFVVIAPDHFVAGERIPAEGPYDTSQFHKRHPEWTAVGKFTYEHSIAVDVLQTLPQVDVAQIGVMGHSLGGHGAMFLAAYDERIKAAACNCGASFFRYNDQVKEWSRDRWYVYFKHIRPSLLEGELPPIDFHEIMALVAPRALLDISAVNDGVEATQRQRVLMNLEVMKAFQLENAAQRFAFFVHGKQHSVPEESRELMASWLHSQLTESTAP